MEHETKFTRILSVGKDTLLYIPNRLAPVLFGFLGLTIYTRLFSPDIYGNYSLIEATVGVLGIFTYGWINESNLRFFTSYKNKDNLKDFFSTSFFILVGALAALTVSLLVLSYFSLLPSVIIQYFAFVVGILVVNTFFETLLTILRSDRRAKEVSIYRTLSSSSMLGASLVLIFLFKLDVLAILAGIFITNLALSLLIILKFNYGKYIRVGHFSRKTMEEFASYGLPLMATLLFSWILWLSNRYVIEFFRGAYEVGIYTTAFQLASYPISLFASMITMAAYPIIVDTWEKRGDGATTELVSELIRYFLLFAVPAFVGISILSQYLMVIVGDSYAGGYTIIPWICFSQLLFGLCFYTKMGLQLKKKTMIQAILIGVSAISNLLLNIVLVPVYGFVGSAAAMTVSYIIFAIVSSYISMGYMNWSVSLGSVKNIVISATIMGIALLAIKTQLHPSLLNLAILTLLGFIVYLVVIWLTGEVRKEMDYVMKYYHNVTAG